MNYVQNGSPVMFMALSESIDRQTVFILLVIEMVYAYAVLREFKIEICCFRLRPQGDKED